MSWGKDKLYASTICRGPAPGFITNVKTRPGPLLVLLVCVYKLEKGSRSSGRWNLKTYLPPQVGTTMQGTLHNPRYWAVSSVENHRKHPQDSTYLPRARAEVLRLSLCMKASAQLRLGVHSSCALPYLSSCFGENLKFNVFMCKASPLTIESKNNSSKDVYWVIHWPGLSPFWAPIDPFAYLYYCLSVILFLLLLIGAGTMSYLFCLSKILFKLQK